MSYNYNNTPNCCEMFHDALRIGKANLPYLGLIYRRSIAAFPELKKDFDYLLKENGFEEIKQYSDGSPLAPRGIN